MALTLRTVALVPWKRASKTLETTTAEDGKRRAICGRLLSVLYQLVIRRDREWISNSGRLRQWTDLNRVPIHGELGERVWNGSR